jgi:DNA repair MmcB-like protein
MASRISARQIESLLEQRHSSDFYASQVKNGPTQYTSTGDLLILDFWAMKKSWSNPLSIGYEIKVSRSDFLQDTKWHGYLDYCQEFYFAAPVGVIDPKELPPEVGLVVCSRNAKMILTKKKAQRRNIEIPESFYRYVLMNKINASDLNDEFSRSSKVRYWERWLKNKEINSELGYHVSKVVSESLVEGKRRSDKLEIEIEALKLVKDFCERNQINYTYYNWKQDIQAKIGGIDPAFLRDFNYCRQRMNEVYDKLCPPEKVNEISNEDSNSWK